ncbi:MAG: heterodisulfide reductase-related iron-sulfur binding cluster [Clostridium sp.]
MLRRVHFLEREKELAGSMVDQIMESAEYKGAEELVTACPLCHVQLKTHIAGMHIHSMVNYFTEILAEALGSKSEGKEVARYDPNGQRQAELI